jgi:1-aminocyclopropane-1-carboxylate deaminase/D-cysteine desulfhydrase-like pyridoxal-dependent ACC family enzyme
LEEFDVRLLIKRDDLIHQKIQGNKWRKLRYNLMAAVQGNHHTVLTFGGAYSNHIAASAYAFWSAGLDLIAVIRGEESSKDNPTLSKARELDTEIHFISREDYRRKTEPEFIDNLKKKFGRFYLIPEGGANSEGLKGCSEILEEVEQHFDIVCCAMGTGTTVAGLLLALKENQKLIGFPALKGGGFLRNEVLGLIETSRLKPTHQELSEANWTLSTDFHFGGYAKMKPELLKFIKGFQKRTGIPLDPVYNGKMMFGVYDKIEKGEIASGQTVLAIHTGGLQGWDGMKDQGKGLP